MSRHFTSLALSASLLLMSSAAFADPAEWTDAACSFADKEMLAALHFENLKPSVERKQVAGTAGSPATTVTTCAVKFAKDGLDRALTFSTSPEGPPTPTTTPTCMTKSLFGSTGTFCGARTKSQHFIAFLGENKSDDETQRLHEVFRGHFERRIAELNL
jgi:hypothetical protein